MLIRELGSTVASDPINLLQMLSTTPNNLTKCVSNQSQRKATKLTMNKSLVRSDKGRLHLLSRRGSRRNPGRLHGPRQIFDRDIPAGDGLVPPPPKLSGYYTNIAGCDACFDSELGGGIQETSPSTDPPMLDIPRTKPIK